MKKRKRKSVVMPATRKKSQMLRNSNEKAFTSDSNNTHLQSQGSIDTISSNAATHTHGKPNQQNRHSSHDSAMNTDTSEHISADHECRLKTIDNLSGISDRVLQTAKTNEPSTMPATKITTNDSVNENASVQNQDSKASRKRKKHKSVVYPRHKWKSKTNEISHSIGENRETNKKNHTVSAYSYNECAETNTKTHNVIVCPANANAEKRNESTHSTKENAKISRRHDVPLHTTNENADVPAHSSNKNAVVSPHYTNKQVEINKHQCHDAAHSTRENADTNKKKYIVSSQSISETPQKNKPNFRKISDDQESHLSSASFDMYDPPNTSSTMDDVEDKIHQSKSHLLKRKSLSKIASSTEATRPMRTKKQRNAPRNIDVQHKANSVAREKNNAPDSSHDVLRSELVMKALQRRTWIPMEKQLQTFVQQMLDDLISYELSKAKPRGFDEIQDQLNGLMQGFRNVTECAKAPPAKRSQPKKTKAYLTRLNQPNNKTSIHNSTELYDRVGNEDEHCITLIEELKSLRHNLRQKLHNIDNDDSAQPFVPQPFLSKADGQEVEGVGDDGQE